MLTGKCKNKILDFVLHCAHLFVSLQAELKTKIMAKKNEIIVRDVNIKTMTINGVDYISITDIAKQKNGIDPNGVVANWMRNRNTIEYLGLWETLHNANFNPLEFEGFRTYLPLEHGEYQCRAHQRRHAPRRTTREAQPDSHSADAGAGRQ